MTSEIKRTLKRSIIQKRDEDVKREIRREIKELRKDKR
jgi:hypothetical protein